MKESEKITAMALFILVLGMTTAAIAAQINTVLAGFTLGMVITMTAQVMWLAHQIRKRGG